MGLVGTKQGQESYPFDPYMAENANEMPTFPPADLIEKYEIKSYFSRSKSENLKNIAK